MTARVRSATPWLIRTGLRLLVEGSWLSVVYAAIAVIGDKRAPALGPLELAVLVGIGALIANRTHDVPRVGAALLVAAVVVGGAAGWLLAGPALSAAFPAVAIARGAMLASDWEAAPRLEAALITTLPAVGVLWAVTLVASEPALVGSFAANALWSTLLLISAGTIGIGLTRLDQLQRSVTDRPTRRAWRLLVIVVGLAVVPIALPFAIASGIPVASVASPLVGIAQSALSLLIIPFYLVAGLLLTLLSLVFRPGMPLTDIQLPTPPPPAASPSEVAAQQYTLLGIAVTAVTFVAIGLVVLVGALLLARWLVGRESRTPGERLEATPDIERAIVHPTPDRPRGQKRGRRPMYFGRPRDAVGAYLAALAELEPFPALVREPAETPGRHASRLRAAAAPVAPDLGHLAADYQLVRYAERPVSRAEDRRALSRFERLRRTLRSIPR